jgi:hypothetical protein
MSLTVLQTNQLKEEQMLRLWSAIALLCVMCLGKVYADPWLDDDFEYASVPNVWVNSETFLAVKCFSISSREYSGSVAGIAKFSVVTFILSGLIGFTVFVKRRRDA